MLKPVLAALALCFPVAVQAEEASPQEQRIVGINRYAANEMAVDFGDGRGFWMQENYGLFESLEGPLESGPVECHGSGFWGPMNSEGQGVCVYGEAPHQHFWRWTSVTAGPTRWEIVAGTGRYEGIAGHGVSTTRATSHEVPIRQRITDWEGVVTMP